MIHIPIIKYQGRWIFLNIPVAQALIQALIFTCCVCLAFVLYFVAHILYYPIFQLGVVVSVPLGCLMLHVFESGKKHFFQELERLQRNQPIHIHTATAQEKKQTQNIPPTAVSSRIDAESSRVLHCGGDHIGYAGQEYEFIIEQKNMAGMPWIKPTEGWTITVSGESVLVPSISYKKPDQYLVRFTPRKIGNYEVLVKFRGIPMQNQPFTVQVLAGKPSPNCSILTTDARIAILNDPFVLTVTTYDEFGNRVKTGGAADRLFCMDAKNPNALQYISCDDNQDGTYTLCVSSPEQGVLFPEVKMDGKVIRVAGSNLQGSKRLTRGNKELRILAVCRDIYDVAIKGVDDKRFWLKATLYPTSGKGGQRNVHVLVTETQVSISESWIFGLYMKRLHTFRYEVDETDKSVVVISDGREQAILGFYKRKAFDALSFVAAIQLVLQNRLGSDSFEKRRESLAKSMKSEYSSANKSQYTISLKRSELKKEGFKILSSMSKSNWAARWRIKFKGEQGLDIGGLYREFMTLMGEALFEPNGEHWKFLDPETHAVHPKENLSASKSKKRAEYYRVCGMFVAKCLLASSIEFEREMHIGVRFTDAIYKHILGLPITYQVFAVDDPQLYKSTVRFMLDHPIDDAGLELSFSYDEAGDMNPSAASTAAGKTIEFKPGGADIEVNDANKEEYLSALAQYLLFDRCKSEIESFIRGFYTLIPDQHISIFDESELEILICGMPFVDAKEWQSHTKYEQYTSESSQVQWFWVVVENMSQVERARLLHFITGSSQVPIGGFANLTPKCTLVRHYSASVDSLPVAHTCFNRLDLPCYESYSQLHDKLLFAVREGGVGFGLA